MFVVVLGTWTEDALCSLHEEHGGSAGLQPASQPAIQAFTVQPYTRTPPTPPPPTPAPQKPKPRLPKHWQKMFPRGRVYLASTGTTWLAGSDIFIYNIYLCVCVCVFLCGRVCGAQ
jgi:hypothetical protein